MTYTTLEVFIMAIGIIGILLIMIMAVDYFENRRKDNFTKIISLAHEFKIDTLDIKNLTALKLLQEKIGTGGTLEFLTTHYIHKEE